VGKLYGCPGEKSAYNTEPSPLPVAEFLFYTAAQAPKSHHKRHRHITDHATVTQGLHQADEDDKHSHGNAYREESQKTVKELTAEIGSHLSCLSIIEQ
jgi:hypothetical protein